MNELLPVAAIISSLASMFLCVSVWTWLRGKGDGRGDE